ncbi:MAG: hypothetical protein A3J74_04390 [Elusimicrobia bacterium RIFCSPHIGHO2_02_FULL_57_9]|nr:MAG: hypothetical protein A3J74_04390 [Elusimicrobia bacterium RIFCSPHIGHO2_02_FULL_57_9]
MKRRTPGFSVAPALLLAALAGCAIAGAGKDAPEEGVYSLFYAAPYDKVMQAALRTIPKLGLELRDQYLERGCLRGVREARPGEGSIDMEFCLEKAGPKKTWVRVHEDNSSWGASGWSGRFFEFLTLELKP